MYAKYEGNTCSGPADCKSKCSTGCDGYSKTPSETVVVQVSMGENFGCALHSDGTVKCWGLNNYAQLGDGSTTTRTTPVDVTLDSAAIRVECGAYHACAILDTGKVQCWGRNHVGQLGIGSTATQTTPVTVLSIDGANDLSLGKEHTCVLINRDAKCWGYNAQGQLGIGHAGTIGGSAGQMEALQKIDIGASAVQITAGQHFTCVLTTNSEVKCWGYGKYGQLGNGLTTNIGDAANEMGDNLAVTLTGVHKVAAATDSTCAVMKDFSVRCWGRNTYGTLGYDDKTQRNTPGPVVYMGGNVVDISGGKDSFCATFDDGQAKCWGNGDQGKLGISEHQGDAAGEMEALPFIDLSATGTDCWMIDTGHDTTCALVDGQLDCFGLNNLGQTAGNGLGANSATYTYTYGSKTALIGISTQLTDACAPCKANEYVESQYAEESYIVKAGQTSYTCDTLAECKPQCDADPNCVGYSEDAGLEVVKVGYSFHFAENVLYSDGTVKCFAKSGYSASCGTDDSSTFYDPADSSTWGTTKLSGPAVDMSRWGDGTWDLGGCAVMADGTLECWCNKNYGNFKFVNGNTKAGDGSNPMDNNRLLDTGVYRFSNFSGGDGISCGILRDDYEGQLACWGWKISKNSNDPAIINQGTVTDVNCGRYFCCYIIGGQVACFGSNAYGEQGIGSTSDVSVTTVAASSTIAAIDIGTHIAAKVFCGWKSTRVVTTNGDLIGWGGNDRHDLGYNDADYSFGNNQGDEPGEMGANLVVSLTNVKEAHGRGQYSNNAVQNDGTAYKTHINVLGWTSYTTTKMKTSYSSLYASASYLTVDDVIGFDSGSIISETPGYSPIHMKNIGLQCVACTEGTYNSPGDTTEGTCDDAITCDANFYSDGTQCVACPDGTISNGASVIDGHSYCKRLTPCGIDEYVNQQSVCTLCPFGTFSDPIATEYTDTPCQKEAGTCGENEHSSIQYFETSNRYSGGTCTDCETTCTNDANCLGYSNSNKVFSVISHRGGYTCSASNQGVRCWGINTDYAFGIGSTDQTLTATIETSTLLTMTGIKALRNSHNYRAFANRGVIWAIFHDGTARCWGYSFAYCGYSVSTDVTKPGPNIYAHGGKIKDIRGSYYDMMMLLEDGRVFGWGYNFADGRNYETNTAIDLGGTVTAISLGEGFFCALIDAKVKCWGNTRTGQETSPTTASADLPFLKGLDKPVVDIQSSYEDTCALFNDGTVKCWGGGIALGYSYSGILGDEAGEMEAAPLVDISGVVQLSAGWDHFCARLDTGGVKCWGAGHSSTPQDELSLGASVDSIQSTYRADFAIIDGNVKAWGFNINNRLGYNDNLDRTAADASFIFSEVYDNTYGSMVSSGVGMAKRSSCGTCPVNTTRPAGDSLSEATWCISETTCGKNEFMNTNYECEACPEDLFNNPGDNSPGICDDQAVCTENQHVSNGMCLECPANTTNPSGDDTNNGNTYCTLDVACAQNEFVNYEHQCTACPEGLYNDVGDNTVGSCDDTEKCLSGYHVKTTFESDNLKKFGSTPCDNVTDCEAKCLGNSTCEGYTAVALKQQTISHGIFSCAIQPDKTLICWGYNKYGQFLDGTTANHPTPTTISGITDVKSIGAGYTPCVIFTNGTLKCWGYNDKGQVGDGHWGSDWNAATPKTILTNVVQVSTRPTSHACALLDDGTVKCWGENTYGQIGIGSTGGQQTNPVTVSGITNAIQVQCGSYSACCAVLSSGVVKCWGSNGNLQIGDDTVVDQHTPQTVTEVSNAIQVSVGYYSACALISDGTIKCWGKGTNGEHGDGTTTDAKPSIKPKPTVSGITNAIQISHTEKSVCAVLATGEIKCWGDNGAYAIVTGTTPQSTGITDAAEISCYDRGCCYTTNSGSVKCWGLNNRGQLGNGDITTSTTPVDAIGVTVQPYLYTTTYGPQIAGVGTSFVKDKGCQLCPAGYNNEAMDDPLLDDTTCDFIPCVEDHKVVDGVCTPCVLGSTKPAGDADPLVDTYCFCGINQHVVDNMCTECPTGSTNDAGDDESGPNTHCTIAPCAKDYHVQNDVCVPCPDGFTNDAGDTNENGDTFCDATFVCLENQYVSNNQCVDCTVGTAPYGADPGGPDTVCVCGKNEYFDGAACQPCGYGTFNDAGSPVDQVGTCDGIDVCEIDEHVSLKFVLHAGQQISNGLGYSSPQTDFEKAKRLCVADEACKGLTKDGTNYYLSDGTMSANAVYDAYLIHRDEYMCAPCPGTGSRVAGDVADAITTCSFTTCAAEEGVEDFVCTPCTGGKIQPTPLNPVVGNQACYTPPCLENEYASGGACVACPTDATNEAGDLPDDGDTICDFGTCGKDHYVSNHACVPCATGFNDPGDWRGEDSTCDDIELCDANEYATTGYGYIADTNKYEGTLCSDSADCETKCTADASCEGYTTSAQGSSSNLVTAPEGMFQYRSFVYGPDGTLYFATYVSQYSYKIYKRTSDGTVTLLKSISDHILDLVYLNDALYFLSNTGYIRKFDLVTLDYPSQCYYNSGWMEGIATDGTNIYFSRYYSSSGYIYKTTASCDTPTEVFRKSDVRIFDMVIHDSKIYFVDENAKHISYVTSSSSSTIVKSVGFGSKTLGLYNGEFIVVEDAYQQDSTVYSLSTSGTLTILFTIPYRAADGLIEGDKLIVRESEGGFNRLMSVSLTAGYNYGSLVAGTGDSKSKQASGLTCTSCPGVGTNPAARVNESTPCTFPNCQTDQYSLGDGACLACPAGRTMPTPVNPTKASQCLCATGERAVNGSCVACPAGFTNEAGDSTCDICYDTGCDFIPCAKDQYVAGTGYDRVCTPCPEGTFSAGGTVTECGALEYCDIDEKSVGSFGTVTNIYGNTPCIDCASDCSSDPACEGYTTTRVHDVYLDSGSANYLINDGSIQYVGQDNYELNKGVNLTLKSIDCYRYLCLGVMPNASVVAWGKNNNGMLGANYESIRNQFFGPMIIPELQGATEVIVGGYPDACARISGTIQCLTIWDRGLHGVTHEKTCASGLFSCYINSGTVYCAGKSDLGQTGLSYNNYEDWAATTITNAVDISCGDSHACALLSDGTVKCWGNNDYGQVGHAEATKYYSGYTVATNAKQVSCGFHSTCVIASTDEVKCIGSNLAGQLGTGSSDTNVHYTLENTGIYAKTLFAGERSQTHCAIKTDDTFACWGEVTELPVLTSTYGTVQGTLLSGTSNGLVFECVACPEGFKNQYGNTTLKGAPNGVCTARTCNDNEYSDGTVCLPCPQYTGAVSAGLDPTQGATQCVPTTCQTDEHVVNNVCTPCDSNSYRLAGDQIFGGDTHCFCRDNQKVINKSCVACEEGSSNPNLCYSGLEDHYCVCHENYHVVNTVCTACPAGATRPAGDYAGNGDTHCFCGENQRVVNNECVACPAGTTKPAGDDSSGPDTECSCVENEHMFIGYVTDTNKYEGNTCDDEADCETKCSADASCEGYSNNGGSVQTWGHATWGGTDPGITSGVTKIFSTWYAFATFKDDGSVQVWGNSDYGGTDPGITSGVVNIFSTHYAFAALKSDGSVVSWGKEATPNAFNDYNLIDPGITSGVVNIFSTHYAFAALKSDGSVVTWGRSDRGGADPGIGAGSGITKIFSTSGAFAALKSDGSVQVWGQGFGSMYPGSDPGIGAGSGVVEIFSNWYAFAALKSDGSVQVFGFSDYGGTDPGITSGVTKIFSTEKAFAALKSDGSVQVWGDSGYGGTDPGITSGVTKIFSTARAFAALKSDGSVQVWGDSGYGGTDPGIGAGSGITKIFSNDRAFAALKSDGSVEVWGDAAKGGADPGITSGVVDIVSTAESFAALKSDGSVQVWGSASHGGTDPGITSGVVDIVSSYGAFSAIMNPSFGYGALVSGTGDSKALQQGCQTCPTGSIRPAGDLVADGATSCACPENHHASNGQCVACVAGTRPAGDDPAVDTHCSCLENHRVQDNVCTACPEGQERLAGDDAGGNNTACACKQNYYSTGSGCALCTEGAIIGAGSDPLVPSQCTCSDGYEPNGALCDACADTEQSGFNTSCVCKENHHYDGSACVACAPGSVRPAGDDKQNVTVCEAVICAENQRVLNNECVNCLPGMVRPAGDEASGIDTICEYQGTAHTVSTAGLYAFRIDTLPNNGELVIRAGETHSFYRVSGGDPFRIVTEADCEGKECNKAKYTSLPTSSLGLRDAEDEVAVTVFTPDTAGLYYYVSTETPYRKGRIVVDWAICTITYPVTNISSSCELSGEETLTGDLTIQFVTESLRAQQGEVPQIKAAEGARHFTVSGGFKLTIADIDLNGGRGTEGGSILVDNGEIDANNVKFTDNIASLQGGAIRVKNAASKIKLSNILFQDNQGTEGGAIATDTLTEPVEIHASEFKANRAASGDGGAIKSDAVINITGTNFEANLANSGEGGGISATKDLTISGSSFKLNKALRGGALKSEENTVTMSNMVVEANEAVEDGGAFLAKNAEFDVRTSTILANKAKRGAAFKTSFTGCTTDCKKLRIQSSSMEGNEATVEGGAVDFDADTDAEPQFWIQDTEMKNNKARGQANDFKRRGSKVKIKAIDSDIGNIDGGAVDKVCEPGQCAGRADSTCEVTETGTECACDGTNKHLSGGECKVHKVCTGLGLDVEIRAPDKKHDRLCGTQDIADLSYKLDDKGKELAELIEAKLVAEGVAADQAYALAVEVFGEINKCN